MYPSLKVSGQAFLSSWFNQFVLLPMLAFLCINIIDLFCLKKSSERLVAKEFLKVSNFWQLVEPRKRIELFIYFWVVEVQYTYFSL